MISKDAVKGKKISPAVSQLRMSLLKTVALFLLMSGFWSQMVSSAPTPQQNDVVADQYDESSMDAGNDYGTAELRYGWERGEPVEPPDFRNPQSSPEIHIVSPTFQDHAQHATSISTTLASPPPPSKRSDLQRSVEDLPDWVFNIVIQKEKAQKSAFIAPDVNWLRDLVPKVVDVVDRPETTIKETIFNAVGKDETDQIKDKQIFINVVKSQVDSEAEVPEILVRLRNLMQTGGPVIDSLFQRQNNKGEPSKNRAVVINVVIVNVLNVNVVNVILPESKTSSDVDARTADMEEEDSYILALRESQKDRHKVTSFPLHHDVPNVGGTTTQQKFNGHYLTEVPTSEHTSTARPLMAMEKDYLRSSDIKPAQQQLVDVTDKQQPADKEQSKSTIDPNASLEFVDLPTGPYFTNDINNLDDQVLVIETDGTNEITPVTPIANNNANKVKKVEIVSSMTNKATNVVRNQIRTIGFIGIPILAGLATVNTWLPALAALGRRRKKRSTLEYEEEYDWQSKVANNDDRRRAIEDAQVLALLMGKHYMNVSKEALQDSIDNWKNRDQEASFPLHTTEGNKLASTNKPLWFQFQRPSRPQTTETTTSTSTLAPSTVKKLNYYEDYETNTNKYYSKSKPSFYSAASVTDDVVEHRELADYDDFSLPSSTGSTESGEYQMGETQFDDKVSANYPESVTPHIHILPDSSPSGNDFDIVANFVQAMMLNNNNKNSENPIYVGPENREDVDGPEHREDGPEHREEYYFIKSPSIVNSTIPGGFNRIPPTGNTVSLFAADPIMPNWSSENVTNSPVTYVSLRVPPVPASKLPATTSTLPSSSEYYDDTDLIDSSDQPSSENVGLQFHEDETGITFFVSKEVPTKMTTAFSSTATQETKPTSTGRPLSQWFSDPFENGLFVGSSTANTPRPPSSVATSNTPTQPPPTRPTSSLPLIKPSGLKPSAIRPPLSNLPGSIPSNNQPNFQFENRPPSSNTPSNFQSLNRPATPITPISQTNRPTAQPPSKFQSNRPSSLLTMASFTSPNRLRPTVPPPVDVSSNDGSKGQRPATNEPNFSTGDSSLVSVNVDKNNMVSSIIKGTGSSPLPFSSDQSTNRPTMGDSNNINNLFGMYSSTAAASTNRPIITTTSSEEELDSTLDNMMTQLEKNGTGSVSTKRPVGGLHFINTSTDVVILSPYTPSPAFSTQQVESVEAEEDEDLTEPSSDAITVDAAEGNQPDSVPAISNLANLFIASSGTSSGSSVSSGSSSSESSSSGGVTGSTSAVSVDPFALLYTFGLASAGILALTLPIWVPLVVAKKRRRTSSYGPVKTKMDKKKKKTKNQYPANKKKKISQSKTSYGEPPPNHYKDLDEDLPYDDHYHAGPVNQYQSTTTDDLYRSNYDYTDVDNFSTLYRDLFSSNSDDVLSDVGPLNSEEIYGPASPTYYDDRRAARRRRSNNQQLKRFH